MDEALAGCCRSEVETEAPRDLESCGWFAPGTGSPFWTGRGMPCPRGPPLGPTFSKDNGYWTMGEEGDPAAGVCKWDGAPEAGELTEEGREPPRLGWERRGFRGMKAESGERGLDTEDGGRKM